MKANERVHKGQCPYDVFRNGRWIDTVWGTDYSVDEMRRSLIDHDGYPSDIVVVRSPR